jgi:heme-degrading monooxygenase HmoA
MKGTNTGPFAGGPPTGQSVALPGADFITVEGNKISSVQGYFDQRTLVEQLGLQAIVQRYSIGPFNFGLSVRATTDKCTKPGAFSLTWIEVRSEEEFNEVRERGRQVIQQMMQIPGFIGTTNVFVGRRLITTTAWEDAEAPKQLLRGGAHKEAMDRFFGTNFAAVGTTMVFVPDHINAMWMRCTACGQVANYDQSQGKCRCGQPLPEHPPYW